MSPTGVYARRLLTPKTCDVEDCEKFARTPGGALCETHYYRLRRTGTTDLVLRVKAVRASTGILRGASHPSWRGDDITYSGAHMRVKSVRGSAATHVCPCGAPARQWSYNHEDSNERSSDLGPYSADPDFYVALCVPCHKRTDLARLRERAS